MAMDLLQSLSFVPYVWRFQRFIYFYIDVWPTVIGDVSVQVPRDGHLAGFWHHLGTQSVPRGVKIHIDVLPSCTSYIERIRPPMFASSNPCPYIIRQPISDKPPSPLFHVPHS